MSEIKGQLLGIILVIIVFGVVAAGISTVFQNLTSSVSSEVAKAVTTNPKAEMLSFWEITASKKAVFYIEGWGKLLYYSGDMEALEIVKEAIKDRINIGAINYDDKLDDLGLDSLDLVETMLKIEEALNVEFATDEIVELKTIRDVVNLIESKK